MPPRKRHDDFLNPLCRPRSLRTYVHRRALLRAVCAAIPHLKGSLLDVGAGYQPYRPLIVSARSQVRMYIPLDLPGNVYQRPGVYWDGSRLPFRGNSVDCAMATEVLEHCRDPLALLSEINRVLRPGGVFFFTVPFLWPHHCVPHDEHRYTAFALERLLEEAGFGRAELHALGGYHASLAQMLALWVFRPGAGYWTKGVWMRLATPIVYTLARLDKPPREFGENQMVTGFHGLAWKAGVPETADAP